MRRLLAGLVLLAPVVVGCSGAGEQGEAVAAGAAPPTTGRVEGTSAAPAAPPACTAPGAAALVRGFFAALTERRVRDLDAYFAPATRFQWYSNGAAPGVRLDQAAADRGTLLGYLLRRQGRHERFAVTWFKFNGYRASDRTGHFGLRLHRAADDLPEGSQRLSGKGAVDCDSGKLMVVSIGSGP